MVNIVLKRRMCSNAWRAVTGSGGNRMYGVIGGAVKMTVKYV